MPGPAADDITVPIILLGARTIWFGSGLLKLEETGCRLSPAQRRALAIWRAGSTLAIRGPGFGGHAVAASIRLALMAALRHRWHHLQRAEQEYQFDIIIPETRRCLAFNRASMKGRLP